MATFYVDNDGVMVADEVKGHTGLPGDNGTLQNDAQVVGTLLKPDGANVDDTFWPATFENEGEGLYVKFVPYERANVKGSYKLLLQITLNDGTRYSATEGVDIKKRTI